MPFQSLFKGIVCTVLKIAADRCPWLNVDGIGQGKSFFPRKQQRKNIGFHEKSQGKCMLFS